jgi:hypothetical protein
VNDDDLKVRLEHDGKSAETTLAGLREAAEGLRRRRREGPPYVEGADDEVYPVPDVTAFVDPDRPSRDFEFLIAADLEEMARDLLGEFGEAELRDATDWRIEYWWRRSGAVTNGRGIYGKTRKLSGELKFTLEADFLITLAADFVRDSAYTYRQVRALLFHELLHVSQVENEKGDVRPASRPHDAEVFMAELAVFGLWSPELRPIAQLRLFEEDDDA